MLKRLLLIGGLGLLTIPLQAGAKSYAILGKLQGPYRVAHVYDGDTIELEGVGKVRLVLIDTPESGQNQRTDDPTEIELGKKAKAFALELARRAGHRAWIEVAPEARDRYGRLLAWVYLPYVEGTTPWVQDGRTLTSLNYELVRQGWATVFVVGSKNTRYLAAYRAAQAEAKRLSLGVWAVYQQIERNAGTLPLRIKCVVYNPPGRDEGNEEIWIEVRSSVRLDGWAVGDDDGLRIPLSGESSPGTYVVRIPHGPHLSNRGDTVLLWRSGRVVDRFGYTGGRGERACR